MATKKKTKETESLLSEGKEFDGNLGDRMILDGGVMKLKEKGRSPNRIPYGEIAFRAVTWKEFEKKAPEEVALMRTNRKLRQ